MDNLIEAAEYLAPHKELFHKELVKLYYFIAADLHKYFNEHEKAEVFSALATEIAIEHVDVSRVFHDKLNRINVYSRDEKFEEAKKEIKIGLALAKQTNNEDFEHIYQFYFFKYLAHVKLNQLDSLAFVNEEIERLCETNLISHNSYMSYFAHILHLDIEINKLENISQQYAYLINELKNTYFSYILHSAMIDYYVKMNNIEKEAFHGTKALDFLGNVIYDEYNLKKIREQLNNLASTLSKKKYYQEADRFRAEIIKIDSVMYDIQKRRSDAYKKSLDFFSNQEVEQANKQVELEKKVRYVYMFLFALVAIFLLFSIYLLYLLFKRNKQINYQKKEIELITNSVSIGLCKIDNNFKLIWANKTIEETYNAAEEFLKSDMNYVNVLQGSYFEVVKEKLKNIEDEEELILEGAMTKDFEPKPIFEEGMIWLKTVYTPVRNKEGVIEAFIVLSDDHTNEKTVEYRLEKQKNKIERMNYELKDKSQTIVKQNFELEQINDKLKVSNENLSQFAAIAAHDLKAPLRTITSFSQILLRKHGKNMNNSDKELFDFIINDAKSLKEMIDGLLAYSKISNENLELTTVSLETIIFMSISKLNASIKERKAEIVVPDTFPMAKGHTTLLGQVVLNLVNNSLKFMPENARPVIKIACKDYDKDYILISIEDNGIGIDKKYHDTIFNIFRKLHSKGEYKGNGIGLSTCKKIVESCGGTMWLESELGKGTTFFFTLQKENSI